MAKIIPVCRFLCNKKIRPGWGGFGLLEWVKPDLVHSVLFGDAQLVHDGMELFQLGAAQFLIGLS